MKVLRLGRVAPGTAYTAATDAISFTPPQDGRMVITAAVSTAVDMYLRVGSVDLKFRADLSTTTLPVDGLVASELNVAAGQTYSIRFSANTTIRHLLCHLETD